MTATFESATAAQRGDRESFARLYESHRRLVYSVVYARVGNAAIAEDLTSETFIRAWSKLHTFDGRNFAAWIRTIANNLTLDLAKSSRWQLDAAVDITSEGPYDTPGALATPDIVERALTVATIRVAVDRLPDYQRRIITDRYLSGYSVAETAARTGVSTLAVKATQHRAVTRLATELPDTETRAGRQDAVRRQRRHTHAILASRVVTAALAGQCRWPRNCTDPIEALGHCQRHYNTMRATGRLASGLTDPDSVRARIAEHLDRGRTLHDLSDAVPLDATALRRIQDGRTVRVRVATAARIMAVPLPPTSTEVTGWIHALTRAGYSHRDIAAAAGVPRPTLRSALYRGTFHARLRVAVAAAHEQLVGEPDQSLSAAA